MNWWWCWWRRWKMFANFLFYPLFFLLILLNFRAIFKKDKIKKSHQKYNIIVRDWSLADPFVGWSNRQFNASKNNNFTVEISSLLAFVFQFDVVFFAVHAVVISRCSSSSSLRLNIIFHLKFWYIFYVLFVLDHESVDAYVCLNVCVGFCWMEKLNLWWGRVLIKSI